MAIIFFLAILFSTSNFAVNASEELGALASVSYGNSTKINNSTNYNYVDNVLSVLSLLVSESSSSNPPLYFFNTSFGRVSPRAYGSYLCRGDLSFDKCQSCIMNVTRFLSQTEIEYSECFGFDLIWWCMVRYSNTSNYAVYEKGRVFTYQAIGENVTNYQQYNETLSNTIQGLITEASYGNWTKANFATKAVKVAGTNQEVFALVQCTPDISPVNCSNCLKELYSYIPDCCVGKQGGVLAHANCLMKYNNHSFFGGANRSFMPGCFLMSLALLLSMYLFI